MIGLKSLCVALLLAVASAPATTLRFAPAEKSSVQKTLSTDSKIHSTSVNLTVDGRELPKELIGSMKFSMDGREKAVLTDRYVKVAGGRPVELDRTYDELVSTSHESQTMPGQEEPVEKDEAKSSDLEGATVRFSWKSEKEEYETSFAGDDHEKSLLEGIREDMDFRAFLPSEDVKVEDTWTLKGAAFGQIFSPSGELHFHEEGKEPKSSKSFDQELAENMAGTGKAVFESIREKDGRKLAVVAIEAELTTSGKEPEQQLNCKVTMKVKGQMLWDIVANHVDTIDLTSDIAMEMSGEQKQDMGGAEHTVEIHIELEGEVHLELTTKAV
jgi:hypothetical protein